MDTDKPSTQLFFCFTSSSSSMKMSSSRSVLSPGRPGYSREPPPAPITLSTSLSRRLSKSRSIRGGAASPAMFPVTGKKRGSGFDNPEPSSPKVTCIGQVRVKTRKKHVKNVRSLSTRRKLKHSRSQRQRNNSISSINSTTGNNNNNQRWVHIPMTICEALRTFGSEVSCLFPCRSSTNEEKKVVGVGSAGWVVALEEGEIEMGSVRRHVFEDLEIVNDVIMGSEMESVDDVVPPKNALLLMRGRSEYPVKMEEKHEEEEEEGVDFEEELVVEKKVIEEINMELEVKESVEEEIVEKQSVNEEGNQEQSMGISEEEEENKEQSMEINEEEKLEKQSIKEEEEEEKLEKQSIKEEEEEKLEKQSIKEEDDEEEESFFIGSLFEEENAEIEDADMKDALQVLFEDEYVEENETGESNMKEIKQLEETEESSLEEIKLFEQGNEEMLADITVKSEAGESNIQEIKLFEEEIEEILTQFKESYETEESKLEEVKHFSERSETGESKSEQVKHFEEEIMTGFTQVSEILERENEEREKIESLPECLLLMMYEPKLSMEVSKETWVCSNDFIRRHSGRKKPPPQPPVESIDESKVLGQTSCSIPASESMIAMLEQKLVNTMGFEPLVLTRCKSEPMRRPRETCCLQNQFEPPRRASFGVGMAGLAG